MIPSAKHWLRDFPFVAFRHGFRDGPNLLVLTALRDHAVALAAEPRDEPAAIFFAFARRPDDVGEAWPLLGALLATNHARRLGFRIDVLPDDPVLREIALDTCLEGRPYEDVRDWFRERMRPL